MTTSLQEHLNNNTTLNALLSKGVFDSVEPINDKPTVGTVGLLETPDAGVSDRGSLNKTTLSDAPNLYKQIGTSMSEEGFIKLPRSLLRSESWKSLRSRQQKLFLYILEKAQHTSYVFKYNGRSILLSPGDLCVSLRRLMDDFNSTVKFKDEKIDLPFIQRAVSAFSKHGLTDTRTDTGITIIKIIYPGIYDCKQDHTDTPTDTSSIHLRYTNEERREGKEVIETIEGAEALDSSLLNLEFEKEQKHAPSAFDAPVQPKVDPEKQKHFEVLWKYIAQNSMSDGHTTNRKPGIKQKDLETWVKKFDPKEIMECLKMTLKAEPTKTWAGYMAKLLKDRISKKEEDSVKGRELVAGVIKKNNMKHIEMKKDYFKDLISDEQNYYYLPSDTLNAILKRSYERAKEREAEDKRQQEEDDKYY